MVVRYARVLLFPVQCRLTPPPTTIIIIMGDDPFPTGRRWSLSTGFDRDRTGRLSFPAIMTTSVNYHHPASRRQNCQQKTQWLDQHPMRPGKTTLHSARRRTQGLGYRLDYRLHFQDNCFFFFFFPRRRPPFNKGSLVQSSGRLQAIHKTAGGSWKPDLFPRKDGHASLLALPRC